MKGTYFVAIISGIALVLIANTIVSQRLRAKNTTIEQQADDTDSQDSLIQTYMQRKKEPGTVASALLTQDNDTPLILQAAQQGNDTALNYFIQEADKAGVLDTVLSATGPDHTTLLMAAVDSGKLSTVKIVLSQPSLLSSINAPTIKEGFIQDTPLMRAASKGSSDIVKELLEHDAFIDASNWQGATAFMQAVQNGNIEMARLLASLGANVNKNNADGVVPLIWAAQHTKPELISFLLTLPTIDVNARDRNGDTAIMHAVLVGAMDSVEALAQHKASLDIKNNDGDTVLTLAAKKGLWDSLEKIINMGANSNAQNAQGDTVLMIALREGQVDSARRLLNYGINPTLKNNDGLTAVDIAVEKGEWPIIVVMAQHGLDINKSLTNGKSILQQALASDAFQEAQALLPYITDPNLPDNEGQTPLMIAIGKNNIPTIKALLAYGANPAIKNNEGQTALTLAANNQEILDLLQGSTPSSRDQQSSQASDTYQTEESTANAEFQPAIETKGQPTITSVVTTVNTPSSVEPFSPAQTFEQENYIEPTQTFEDTAPETPTGAESSSYGGYKSAY
jgi:ankyrin repeat protein